MLRGRWLAIVRQFRRGETPARRGQLHGLAAAGLVASPGERRRKRWGIGAQEVEAGPRGGFNARLPSTL